VTSKERDAILHWLDREGVQYEHYEHEEIHTSDDAAAERGVSLGAGVKSILLEGNEAHFLYVLPGDRLVDFNRVSEQTRYSAVSLASKAAVKSVTGCEVGSVPPFGPLFGIDTYVDETVLDREEVHCSVGTHQDSAVIPVDVFKRLGCVVVSASRQRS
jgi:Ala-tRNA(Pro) deacylase